MNTALRYKLIQFVVKFFFVFIILYYGTLAIIGLSVEGGIYSKFVHDHMDYVSWLRSALLTASNSFCHLLNYDSFVDGKYVLRDRSGIGVRMVYKCIGYGIMCFWAAYIIANSGSIFKKFIWLILGWLFIFFINVIRIGFLLISVVTKHKLPYNIDHHDLFNVIAYMFILALMYFYDKSLKTPQEVVMAD